MKRILLATLIILGLVVFAGSAHAQSCPGINNFFLRPLGYQQLTVSNTAVGFTLPTVGTTRLAVVMIETNPIRTRDDGTSPTATVGMPFDAKIPIFVCQSSLAAFKAIRQSSDATLSISYYGTE